MVVELIVILVQTMFTETNSTDRPSLNATDKKKNDKIMNVNMDLTDIDFALDNSTELCYNEVTKGRCKMRT